MAKMLYKTGDLQYMSLRAIRAFSKLNLKTYTNKILIAKAKIIYNCVNI